MYSESMQGTPLPRDSSLHAILNSLNSIWAYSIMLVHSRKVTLGGPCPALRTLFYRLGRLASMPISVVVVFDGPFRPAVKRGKKVIPQERVFITQMKELIRAFGFYVHEVSLRLIALANH